jgi:rare lipoprotein A
MDLLIPDTCIVYYCSSDVRFLPQNSLLMPFFGLVWVTSWVSFFLASSQDLLKVPNYFSGAFPAKVFSVVDSPLEIPTPLFPAGLYSEIWSTNSFATIVPNLAFQLSGSNSPSRPQSTQSINRPLSRVDAVENPFCRPESKPAKNSVLVAPIPQSSSALKVETSARDVSKGTFSQQLLQVVQNLLPRRQRVESVEQSVASSTRVVSTLSGEEVGDKRNREVGRAKRGFGRYSQLLMSRVVAASPPIQREQFQVWVKGRIIAQFPNQQQADLMAQRLKQFFSNPSAVDLNALSVEPALFDGLPGVKIGDRLLFKVDDTLAAALNRNPELLVIEWANNVRIALGKVPLKLAEAQKQLYNLVETPKKFNGKASWYGPMFHGRPTATGETYSQHELTAAHPSLPFDTYVKVRNLKNDNSVIVRINDRGPYVGGRSLDLSREAARCINGEKAGIMSIEAVIMRSPSTQPDRYLSKN